MPGIKALRSIQLGAESVAGTAVAATTIWRGQGVIEDQRDVVFPEEDIGYISGTDLSYVPTILTAITMDETVATFEQLPYILNAGIEKETGTVDGTGSGYVWKWVGPTTAKKTLQTYTIEGGDDQQFEECAYAFVEDFTISGEQQGALMMSANWLAKTASTTTKTAALSVPDVTPIPFGTGALYIDDASGTIGSTQKSNTLRSMSLEFTTGWHQKFTIDALDAVLAETGMPEIVLEMQFLHDGTATAEKTAWRNQTSRLVRLEWTGPALTTTDTETNKRLTIDLAGKWDEFEALDDEDGNDVITARLRCRYNSTAALFFETVIVNELTTLP